MEAYCPAAIVRFPLTHTAELIYFPLTQRAAILHPFEAYTLETCGSFRTPEELARHIATQFPFDTDVAQASASLSSLIAAGALLSKSEFDARSLELSSGGGSPGVIRWLGIPTRNRADLLCRAISSYIANIQTYGRSISICVSDDTLESESRAATRSALGDLSVTRGLPVYYAGREEKWLFTNHLVRETGAPREVIEFALSGYGKQGAPSFGAARNTILFQTVGELVLFVDDDTVCETGTISSELERKHLSIAAEMDPAEYWVFDNVESARACARSTPLDFVGEHENYLGAKLHDFIAEDIRGARSVDTRGMCSHILSSIMCGRGQVLLSRNGLIGDSGLESALGLLANPSDITRRRLTETESAYQLAMRSRHVVRQSRRPTITHGGADGPGMFNGLDNRQAMPPYIPNYRNEDGLYGLMLSRCFDGASCAHLPFSAFHSPTEERSYNNTLVMLRMTDVISSAVLGWTPPMDLQSPSDRICSLGRHLKFIGTLNTGDFENWLTTTVCTRASRIIQALDGLLLRENYSPEYWAAHLTHLIATTTAAAKSPETIVPIELAHVPAEEARAEAQQLLKDFGELVSWWPSLIDAARVLAANGVTVAQLVCER